MPAGYGLMHTLAAAFLTALTYTCPLALASPVSLAAAAEISSATDDVASAAARHVTAQG